MPGDDAGDQRRVVTPWDAIAGGSTHLVMGRSITGASSPAETVQQILDRLTPSDYPKFQYDLAVISPRVLPRQ